MLIYSVKMPIHSYILILIIIMENLKMKYYTSIFVILILIHRVVELIRQQSFHHQATIFGRKRELCCLSITKADPNAV